MLRFASRPHPTGNDPSRRRYSSTAARQSNLIWDHWMSVLPAHVEEGISVCRICPCRALVTDRVNTGRNAIASVRLSVLPSVSTPTFEPSDRWLRPSARMYGSWPGTEGHTVRGKGQTSKVKIKTRSVGRRYSIEDNFLGLQAAVRIISWLIRWWTLAPTSGWPTATIQCDDINIRCGKYDLSSFRLTAPHCTGAYNDACRSVNQSISQIFNTGWWKRGQQSGEYIS